MRSYNSRIHRTHEGDVKDLKGEDPFKIEYHYHDMVKLAKGFYTNYQSSGVLNRNDVVQEANLALLDVWNSTINWDEIREHENPGDFLSACIWTSVRQLLYYRIADVKNTVRLPPYKQWEIKQTNDVDDFLTQLFPQDEFEGDGVLNITSNLDVEIERYDVEQLGCAFNDMFLKHLSEKEQFVIENLFGVNCDSVSIKKLSESSKLTHAQISKLKNSAINKLRNDEVKEYLRRSFDFA